jgi:hypothetical protein
LYALHAAEQRWAERDTCLIVEESEVETRKRTFRLRVFEAPEDPQLRLLIGDVTHNLRHALDHLAYRLAIVVSGTDPPPNEATTQFPITSSPSRFKDGLAAKVGPKGRMPQPLYDALESLQPYQGGNRVLLSTLYELDNLDKHRFPPLVAGTAWIGPLEIEHAELKHFVDPRIGAQEDGTPILTLDPTDANVDMQLHFTGAVALHKGSPVAGGQPVIRLLSAIRALIRDEVFPTLEPFL